MNLTLIVSLVSALCAGAVGYGTAAHFYDIKILKMENEAQNVRIEIQRAARATIDRLTQQVGKAQADAQVRNAAIRRDMDSAGNAGLGLRDTSAAAVRSAADDSVACSAIVRAYDIILAEGSGLLKEVAAVADQCISDNQTLTDGWAK